MPQQDHPHEHEKELIFQHPNRHVKISTSNMVSVHHGNKATPIKVRAQAAPAPESTEVTPRPNKKLVKQEIWGPMAGSLEGRSNLSDRHKHVLEAYMGVNSYLEQSLAAAKFLAAGRPMSNLHHALQAGRNNPDAAALIAYGIEVTPETMRALQVVKGQLEGRREAPRQAPSKALEPEAEELDLSPEDIYREFSERGTKE